MYPPGLAIAAQSTATAVPGLLPVLRVCARLLTITAEAATIAGLLAAALAVLSISLLAILPVAGLPWCLPLSPFSCPGDLLHQARSAQSSHLVERRRFIALRFAGLPGLVLAHRAGAWFSCWLSFASPCAISPSVPFELGSIPLLSQSAVRCT